MKAPETPWGDTCPILKIANHYGADYTDALYIADYFIHGRRPLDTRVEKALDLAEWHRMCDDIRAYSERFKAL